MKWLYICISLIINPIPSFAKKESQETTPHSERKPLVLQWEVSHSRNTDQISLIFRQDYVELVTNISFSGSSESARLGHFNIPLNPQLKILKEELKQYHTRLKNTVSISSLVKTPQSQIPTDPHASVLHINNQEINRDHIYFKYLKSTLLSQVENKNWRCIDCAVYKLLHKETPLSVAQIQRTTKNKKRTTTQTFSTEELKCRTKGKNSWECIDPHFGSFVLNKK